MTPHDAGPKALETVELVGRHVRLEPLSLDHIEPLARAAAGPRETFGWTFVPEGLEKTRLYVDLALEEQRTGRSLPFATIDVARGEVVGSTRYCNVERWPWPPGHPDARVPGGGADAVEIGSTWLAARVQRSAVNTEAKRMMLAHAFEVWRVHRVTLKTDERNARSRAAIERLGARADGVLRGHMIGADGAVRNTAFYSILAAEWPGVRERLDARLAR